jgi:hypothetical protein
MTVQDEKREGSEESGGGGGAEVREKGEAAMIRSSGMKEK